MKTRSHCVNCHHVAGGVAAIDVDWTYYEQLFPKEPFVLLRRYNSAENARDDHA
jgi:hypothetical protein